MYIHNIYMFDTIYVCYTQTYMICMDNDMYTLRRVQRGDICGAISPTFSATLSHLLLAPHQKSLAPHQI